MFLPDVNVWVALAFESHVHHVAANNWFDSASNEMSAFCRMTQQGFLRLATNPKMAPAGAVTLSDAWKMYDNFLADPDVCYSDEPPGLELLWRGYTQGGTFTHKVWNDAFLAAFARAADCEMVTFDKEFAKFTNLRCTILS